MISKLFILTFSVKANTLEGHDGKYRDWDTLNTWNFKIIIQMKDIKKIIYNNYKLWLER
jgi:hypothetical protein